MGTEPAVWSPWEAEGEGTAVWCAQLGSQSPGMKHSTHHDFMSHFHLHFHLAGATGEIFILASEKLSEIPLWG